MPFAAGTFARLYRWVTEAGAPPIEIAKLDEDGDDVATALSNCILRDGTGVPSANTPWNGKKITDLADPTTAQDAATKAYVDGTSGTFVATITNTSGPLTGTINYRIAGQLCTLWCEANIQGTSVGSATTLTGIPAGCRPSSNRTIRCVSIDNSQFVDGTIAIGTSGSASLYTGLIIAGVYYPNGNFTSSGQKGLPSGFTVTYPL